jgi:hypothetical protein
MASYNNVPINITITINGDVYIWHKDTASIPETRKGKKSNKAFERLAIIVRIANVILNLIAFLLAVNH